MRMTERKYSQYFLPTAIPRYGLKIGVHMATYILQYDDTNRPPSLEPFVSEQNNQKHIFASREELNDTIKKHPVHTRIRYSNGSAWQYSIVGTDSRIRISMSHCSIKPNDA